MEALSEIKAIQKKYPITYLSLPTGAGKTVTALEWIKQEASTERFHIWLTHRTELARQAETEAATQIDHKLIVMTWQSAKNAVYLKHFRPQCLIIDEIHWGGTKTALSGKLKSITRAIDIIKPERILFLSATPERIDEETLGPVGKETNVSRSITEGIKEGYLSPVKIVALPPSDETKNIIDSLHPAEMKNCLFIMPSIEDAEIALKSFRAKYPEITACTLHSRTKGNPLRIAEIRNDTFRFVFSVGMCDTGFDWPSLENVVLAKANLSNHRRIRQIIGRVARLSKNKKHGTFFYSESESSYKKDISAKIGSSKISDTISLQDWLLHEIEKTSGKLTENEMRCIIISILLNAQKSLNGFALPKIKRTKKGIETELSDDGKRYSLETVFHKKRNLPLSIIETLKKKALSGERKPIQKSEEGRSLRTLLHINSNGKQLHPEFRKWILSNAPHWLLETTQNISAASKKQIREIIKNGSHFERKSILWKRFVRYVKHDQELREFVESTRPELILEIEKNCSSTEKADSKKRQIISYATAGFTRKQLKEKGLEKRMLAYTSPSRKEFDVSFTKEIYDIAPDWFPKKSDFLLKRGIVRIQPVKESRS